MPNFGLHFGLVSRWRETLPFPSECRPEDLDRKILVDIAIHEGEAFGAIIAQAKRALEDKPAPAEEDFLPLDGGGWVGVTSDVEPHVVRHPSLTLPIKGREKNKKGRRSFGSGALFVCEDWY
jgi:hypothetical protein